MIFCTNLQSDKALCDRLTDLWMQLLLQFVWISSFFRSCCQPSLSIYARIQVLLLKNQLSISASSARRLYNFFRHCVNKSCFKTTLWNIRFLIKAYIFICACQEDYYCLFYKLEIIWNEHLLVLINWNAEFPGYWTDSNSVSAPVFGAQAERVEGTLNFAFWLG